MTKPKADSTRRDFLKVSGAGLASAAVALSAAKPGYTAEDNEIKIALVGCGGRGTGAIREALSTSGPTRLYAMADVFDHRLQASLKAIQAVKKNVDVPKERQFIGMDAFKKAIDILDKGDVVLLTTPAGFRPIHYEYAVQRGLNIFMEKSFAVDAPGIQRMLKANELAKEKNLKIAGGLMWRHCAAREECIKRIHDGEIGDLTMLRAYRMHGSFGYAPKKPGMNELGHQISNYNCFTWLNSSFFVDWHCHNVDICCWAKNAWPIDAQGMGGRAQRKHPDQAWDHYLVEYTFPDGTKLFAQTRQQDNCYGTYQDLAHGTKGSAIIMQNLGAAGSRLFKNHIQTTENEIWKYPGNPPNPYQVEHDLLFDAIRKDKPYNETDRCAKACMTAIMGRMAAHSGKLVTIEQAMASKLELAPGLDQYTWDSNPPVMPDADGKYPYAIPGETKEL
ncbi:MAG TPA: twin-arginine translocation signal domain-containing protein [Planctomycetota bacterium]|jgi:predicted dehydrogenase